nr:hypothetical protein [Tanacetum cinerariifolium]
MRVVWGHVGDVGHERLRPGDIKLLLVAFDSQLKVFHSLKNDSTSGARAVEVCLTVVIFGIVPMECKIKIDELKENFNKLSIEINKITKENEFRQREQAANLSIYTVEPSRCFNFIYDDDNDDEESNIPLNEIISQNPLSIAITPVLTIEDPEDFLIMRNEDLNTIPKKESDEFIKSSVEDFVPIPSKFEDTSDIECDLPFCGNSMTFFNPLFDLNDELSSSDDESLSDEDVPKDNEIESKVSYDSNLDEPALLVTPLFDSNEDEDGYYDSEGDILYLESLLGDDTTLISLLRSEDTIFDPEIFAFHLELVASHWSGTFICFNVYPNILNESPMEIFSFTHFNPNIPTIWGESS